MTTLHSIFTPAFSQPLHFLVHDLLGQAELRDAIHQHAARLVQRLVNGHVVAELGQFARGRQAARAGADHRHFPAAGRRDGERLRLRVLAGPIRHVALQVADGHRHALVAADALDFALGFLRAHPPGDRRQGVVAEQALRRFRQFALRQSIR